MVKQTLYPNLQVKSIPYFKQFLELVFCFKISKFEAGKADTKEVDLPLHSLLGYPNG